MDSSEIQKHALALKAFFVIIFALLLSFIILKNLQGRKSSDTSNPLPATPSTQSSGANKVELVFQPQSQILRPQQPVEIGIMVNNDNNLLSAVSVKLIFDKDKLTFNEPVLENFFPNAVVLENSVDNKQGRISLSLGSPVAATGSGMIARLTGVVNSGVSGETDIVILPESKVMRQGSATSILSKTGHTSLNIVLY